MITDHRNITFFDFLNTFTFNGINHKIKVTISISDTVLIHIVDLTKRRCEPGMNNNQILKNEEIKLLIKCFFEIFKKK